MLPVEFFLLQAIFFGTLSCHRLKSFDHFLEHNHLNHGIIIMCNDGSLSWDELKDLSAKPYWLSYFNVEPHTSEQDIVVAFQNLFYHSSPKVGIIIDMECQSETLRILELASTNKLFNSSQAWFILANNTAMGQQALARMEINIDADITLGVKMPREDILRLYDLYKVCHRCGSALQTVVKGNWSVNGGIKELRYFWQSTVQRRKNFSGIILKGGVVINDAPKNVSMMEYLESLDNKHLDAMQRKTYHLLKILKDIFNFRLEVIISDSWGIQQDGHWTGVMGNLLNGKAAISLSPLRFTQQRVLAVQYLPEVHVEIIRFLFRHPRRSPIRNIFLQPFTAAVWYTVVVVIAVGVLLMAITMRYECKRYGPDGSRENKLDFFTLIILEAIFLQGPSQMFQFVSSRMLIISICIFAVMLYQFYSAFIVGSLLADVPRTIVNMPALFNSSLDVGMEDIAYNYEFFINTSNQMAKDIYVHRIMRSPRTNILPLEKGVQRIGEGGYAYHVAVVRAYRILKERLRESEFCDLQELAMDPPFASCPAVPHGSPYKEHFASAILYLRETGLMAYSDKLWPVGRPQCTQEMMEKDTTVDIEHFIPALGFLTVAIFTSCIVFLMELFTHSLDPLEHLQQWQKIQRKFPLDITKHTNKYIPYS